MTSVELTKNGNARSKERLRTTVLSTGVATMSSLAQLQVQEAEAM